MFEVESHNWDGSDRMTIAYYIGTPREVEVPWPDLEICPRVVVWKFDPFFKIIVASPLQHMRQCELEKWVEEN